MFVANLLTLSVHDEWRVGDPVIKNGGLEIQLSRMEGWRSSYQEWWVGDPVIKNGGLEIQVSRMVDPQPSILDNWISNPPFLITGSPTPHS
jgi:hypothetical protein